MNRICSAAVAFGLASLVALADASACTGIRVKAEDGSIVYARTLEFGENLQSQVLFIPRQYEFNGTTASGKPGLTWMSRYAALGLNGAEQDILADGVNEHGLAAGIFYMPGYAEYQSVNPGDEHQSLAPWELVTWVLTNFANVDEVRAALPTIKVSAVAFQDWKMVPPLHYVVHDATGNSLVIEYTEGKLHVFDNPIGVITNAPTFDWHLTNLRNYINLSATNARPVALDGVELAEFGQGSGLRGLPGDFTPPSRFVRAVALSHSAIAGKTGPDAVLEAFHILDSFDIPRGAVRPAPGEDAAMEYTQWTSASDLTNKRYYFHTYDYRKPRMVEMSQFDVNAKRSVLIPIPTEDAFEHLEVPTVGN